MMHIVIDKYGLFIQTMMDNPMFKMQNSDQPAFSKYDLGSAYVVNLGSLPFVQSIEKAAEAQDKAEDDNKADNIVQFKLEEPPEDDLQPMEAAKEDPCSLTYPMDIELREMDKSHVASVEPNTKNTVQLNKGTILDCSPDERRGPDLMTRLSRFLQSVFETDESNLERHSNGSKTKPCTRENVAETKTMEGNSRLHDEVHENTRHYIEQATESKPS